MRRRIAIDMRMMKPFPTGIGTHFLYLIQALVKEYPDNEYVLIIQPHTRNYVHDVFKNLSVTYVCIDIPASSFLQYLCLPYLYVRIALLQCDIIITDIWSSIIWYPIPNILMVYDLIGFHGIVPVSMKQQLYDKILYKYCAQKATL